MGGGVEFFFWEGCLPDILARGVGIYVEEGCLL